MSIRGAVAFDEGVIASGEISPQEAADLVAILCQAACARNGRRFEDSAFVSFACSVEDLYDGIYHEGIDFDETDEAILKRIRTLVRPKVIEGSLGAKAHIPNRSLNVILRPEPSATLAAASLASLPSRIDHVERITGMRPVAKAAD